MYVHLQEPTITISLPNPQAISNLYLYIKIRNLKPLEYIVLHINFLGNVNRFTPVKCLVHVKHTCSYIRI